MQEPARPVTQDWVHGLTFMQQTVLLTAIRGPDGIAKYANVKFLLRWYRRCVLFGALDHNVFTDPADPRGGSFTGPSVEYLADQTWQEQMDVIVSKYLKELDAIPHHFQMHLTHAIEIVGYKHPDLEIRKWWHGVYLRLVKDLHLNPETEGQLDYRLGDSEDQWRSTADHATQR